MGKKELREFEIHLVRLTNGEHTFDYKINPAFFSLFPETIVDQGQGKARLLLHKTETMLTLHFEIDISLTLTCDVSLREFDQPIHLEKRLMVKYGEEDAELDDEVIVIQQDKTSINIADLLHQYISLEIPMKKVHPELAEEDRPDMAYMSASNESTDKDDIDPRWEALKKLKNKN